MTTESGASWRICEEDLWDLTPEKTRALIERCFFEAQKEAFARAKGTGGQVPGDEELRASIAASVRYAFVQSGVKESRPTAAEFETVVAVLARKAAAWGTPPDVIETHRSQIGLLLSRYAATPYG